MRKLFHYLLLSIILYSCGQKKRESHLNGFDISPDIKNIVFSYKKDSLYSIYIQSLTNGEPHIIFSGSGNYVNPKYTNDGKTIVSLYYPSKELAPEFHFYDLVNRKLTKKIKINPGFVSDYTFSSENKIFYLQAKTFASYSPIAPKAYHDYDIYELHVITSKSKKLTNLNSYYMSEVLNWKKDSLLVSIQGEPNNSGIFLFDIKSNLEKKISLNKIIIKNDTLRNSSMYANPVILSNNDVLCSSSYQMVKLDLKNQKEYPILPSTGYHYNIIRNVKNMIFYQQNDNTDSIYYFNLDDKKMNSLNINISNNSNL